MVLLRVFSVRPIVCGPNRAVNNNPIACRVKTGCHGVTPCV
nr:MAG TPA: hypothetical protein [Caudoviricetes sp.]